VLYVSLNREIFFFRPEKNGGSNMKIGLWSDCHNFPSLPLMKLSAYHKKLGDSVSLYLPLEEYDVVYASKVFSFTADIDAEYEVRADELRRGGTGYCISVKDGKEVFDESKNTPLPREIEHIYPDYGLYPQYNFAVGYLTRGCPRNCGFCVVGKKEGCRSEQVAELSEFWRGQKIIKLLDPNILACKDHEQLLQDLANSGAMIDFTQGLDIRLMNSDEDTLKRHRHTMIAEPVILQRSHGYNKGGIKRGKAPTITATGRYEQNNFVAIPVRNGEIGEGRQAERIYSVQGKAVSLKASNGGGGSQTGLYKIDLPDGNYIIRKLYPIEAERCQTIPDNYTEGISNTQRYKCIGNGWTVDVISHILKQLRN